MVSYLEAHSGLDLFTEHLGDGLVKVGHDLDGKLRLDTTTTDKIVQGICKCAADAVHILLSTMLDGDEFNRDLPRIAIHLVIHALLSHDGDRLLCNARAAW